MLDSVLLVAVLVVLATGIVLDGLLQLLAATLRPALAAIARPASPHRAPSPAYGQLARR